MNTLDYSVGSLSDLITGSSTPNKQKVVQKKITPKKQKLGLSNDNLENGNNTEDTAVKDNDSLKKIKKHKTEKLVKKRKSEDGIEEAPSPKKKKKGKSEIPSLVEKGAEDAEVEEAALPKLSKNEENAGRRIKKKNKVEKPVEDPELSSRTVFVGNLPISLTKIKLKKMFKKYGLVEAVRLRGIPVANPSTLKKVAVIKKEFHPERNSLYGFVRFFNAEDAVKATVANGIIFQDHHLRVHLCNSEDKPDESKAIFVGNLNFNAEEDDLWQLFESCGAISSVRIVRDGRTGMGKGFGYVNFQTSDSVHLALEMGPVKLKDRELRISLCNINAAKKNKKKNKVKKINKAGKPKIKKISNEGSADDSAIQKEKIENKTFQGTKFANKKKHKLNKGLLEKKKMVKKLAPKIK